MHLKMISTMIFAPTQHTAVFRKLPAPTFFGRIALQIKRWDCLRSSLKKRYWYREHMKVHFKDVRLRYPATTVRSNPLMSGDTCLRNPLPTGRHFPLMNISSDFILKRRCWK